MPQVSDADTAGAFATSWNTLPAGSVYTKEQFEDWFSPLTQDDIIGRSVLELGCGNASLMVHMVNWHPNKLVGVDLGDSVLSATRNMRATGFAQYEIVQGDLTTFDSDGFDLVYCIGVLHHLQNPEAGFDSVIRNTRPGGRFHCWVYAREGNGIVIALIEPLRRIASKLPWWFTKYAIAAPLAALFYIYAKTICALRSFPGIRFTPLYRYSIWIAAREYAFFHHVAFDQLVTPATVYVSEATIWSWLRRHPRVDLTKAYVLMRNGNSWKFGGTLRL
jgi:SAM-dependent methyltransferase